MAWPLHSGARIAQEWRLSGTYDPRDAFGRGPDSDRRNPRCRHRVSGITSQHQWSFNYCNDSRGRYCAAIERMQTFCNGRASNTNDILADGLTIVIWQTLERISRAGDGQGARFISKSLVFSGPESAGIRARIRKGLIGQVMQNVETQSRQAAWNLQNTFGGE